MTGHLCLKWNNHCSAFINSISNIQVKEKFCDATIVCQGKYFPVHRIILTTCSEYFEEIFDRMECQHPYVVFKDIDAVEMELLLSYMYQGEINVVQEKLPYLIKAAEALKIKGLAVPDDLPLDDDQLERITCSEVEEGSLPRKQYDEKGKKNGSKDTEGYRNVHSENTHGFPISAVVSESIANKDAHPGIESSVKPEPTEIGHYRNLAHVAQASNIHAPGKDDSIHKPVVNLTNNDAGCSYINANMTTGSENVFNSEQPAPVWTDFQQQIIESFPKTERAPESELVYEDSKSASFIEQEEPLELQNITDQSKKSKSVFHKCSFCPYKSYNKASVTLHTRFKHTGEKPFACSYCPKRFVTKLILNRHIRTHTGEKQYKCALCSFECIQKVHLQKHMLSHTGQKNSFQCEHCSKAFSQLESLRSHMVEEKCYES